MKSRKIFLLLSSTSIFFLLFLTSLSAQSLKNRVGTIFQQAKVRFDNHQRVPLEVRFQDDQKISISSFFEQYRRAFAWSDDNEAISYKQLYDDLGQIHHRYKQYYKGIEMAEVQYLVHETDGSVTYAHGKLIHGLNLGITPEISESQALERALQYIGANSYMWEDRKSEAFLKKIYNNREATYFPVGELIISSGLMPKVVENFKLVYRFDIYAESPMSRNYVDVNAKTGEIVGVIPRLYSDDVEGTGTTLYNGDVDIIVSDNNSDDPDNYPVYSHVNDWSAYGGSGTSWWIADTSLGSEGGYSDYWYQVLDTDPVNLYGEQVSLSFRHRFAAEPPSPPDQMPEGYDGWDGMNVRISIDDGDSWLVLENPTPIYSNESLFSFGNTQGEGEGIPGWAGENESWTEVNFDISAYIGYTVKIRFAFASDPAVSTEFDGNPDWFGWQLDDIVIKNLGDTLFSNTGQAEGMTGKNNLYLPGNYRLREIGRSDGIETYDLQNQGTLLLAVDFVDDDNNFSDLNTQAGVSVHWAAEASYDYYLSEHGRNSFDDDGGKILSYVHLGVDVFNAYWNGAYMQFGDGDASNGYRPLVGIDIVGHELTHGVTQYSADLIYQDEYGALNESFSDIFGEHIESFATNGGHDWLIGDDSGAIRSFTNPNAYTQPDTYFGDFWYNGAEDNGGVHINSGVQNFWFYLLVMGGTGVNDNGDPYTVSAIGFEDASKIAYRNLTVYLMPTSEYEDAKLGSINAAIDLFGATSSHVLAVVNAWNAVGVYYPFMGPYPENHTLNGTYFSPGTDTLYVQSIINNPKDHELELITTITSFDYSLTDSIQMYDDGLHWDNNANDDIWGGYWPVPSGERDYSISTTSVSLDSGFSNILRDAAYITTKGPVSVEMVEITSEDSVVNPGDLLVFEFWLKNIGKTDTVYNITSKTRALDECAEVFVTFSDPEYGNIAPGDNSVGSRGIRIRFNDCPAPAELSFVQEIYSDNNLFWSDTFTVDIVTAINDFKNTLPGHFSLNQNYPNPFNPTTTINYDLPITNYVELSIHNLLGQKVAILVNEHVKAGSHQVEWDASGFASGVYYYKISAGEFQAVRKMILLR